MNQQLQSTLPALGATPYSSACGLTVVCFNPRSPVGSDDDAAKVGDTTNLLQSTRPCGERLSAAFDFTGVHTASIHAPTWGATRKKIGYVAVRGASIHAPTGGATAINSVQIRRIARFNPRSRVGSDLKHRCACKSHPPLQSTLPQGERPTNCDLLTATKLGFNPRSCWRSDIPRR